MKKYSIFLFFSIVFVALSSVSCNNQPKEQTREDAIDVFRSSLTAEDTTTMLNLCNVAMDQLKQGQIEDMIHSLYEYDDSTKQVSPLTEKTLNRYKRQFQRFPVKDFQLQYYSMMLEGCNDVKYQVTFATAEQTGAEPATTMYMFNPVKVDGEWKLCVKTQNDEFDEEQQ